MPARAVGIPADLALDRTQALDDDDDLLADAIFLDRLDLHPAERNVVHVDRVIDLADADRRLALDFQPRRARAKAVARLAAGQKLAEIDVLVEFQPDHAFADPDDARRDLLRRQLDRNLLADLRAARRFRAISPPAETLRTRISRSPSVADQLGDAQQSAPDALVAHGARPAAAPPWSAKMSWIRTDASSALAGDCRLPANERLKHWHCLQSEMRNCPSTIGGRGLKSRFHS